MPKTSKTTSKTATNKKPVLLVKYNEEIVPELKKKLKISNKMALPKITKITVNTGIGTYTKKQGNKDFSHIVENIATICGQKPVVTKSRLSISNFKIREGDSLGVKATIRGERMYHFLNKLINITLPRVRDFRGLPRKSFDKKGNYSLGFKEHLAFPEAKPDDIQKIHGLQINICTNAKDKETATILLEAFNFPFKKS